MCGPGTSRAWRCAVRGRDRVDYPPLFVDCACPSRRLLSSRRPARHVLPFLPDGPTRPPSPLRVAQLSFRSPADRAPTLPRAPRVVVGWLYALPAARCGSPSVDLGVSSSWLLVPTWWAVDRVRTQPRPHWLELNALARRHVLIGSRQPCAWGARSRRRPRLGWCWRRGLGRYCGAL